MGKVVHTAIGINFIEESLKNIKDFFEEVTEDDLRDLYCYRIFGIDYKNTKTELEYLKKSGKTCIPNSSCVKVNPDGTCGCNS